MADDITKKASLFGETWRAIKASRNAWGPFVIGFSLILAAGRWFSPVPEQPEIFKQVHDNPQLLKQHPELTSQFMGAYVDMLMALLPYVLMAVVVYAIFYYLMMVTYLRFAMTASRPDYSVGGFFYWFSRVLWKCIRPILWMFIPFVGPFFYIRSIVRYTVVSPLAILRRAPELKSSWDMTEGNWWRIFWNQMGIAFFLSLIVWGVALIPLVALLFAVHGDANAPLYHGVICLIYGLSMGLGIAGSAIFYCTVYRVLLKERKQVA